MDKYAIIKLKKEGISNRKAAKLLSINRKTVARYWNEYQEQQHLLQSKENDPKVTQKIQEEICSEPTYNTKGRKAYRYTEEMDLFLDEILENEAEKCKILGSHKQQLTQYQIYDLVCEKGFDISRSTICNKIREKRKKPKECFIRQEYDYGERLEYDFGEVKLVIDGVVGTYHMAVLSSPAANYRWAYLYKNQKKEVFMDSHVKFFEMMKGVHKEIVYDNMKNVVTKFIGPHEKELNKNLLKLSLYYGFDINVTNCYSGNEKGHVEGSVKIIRNKVFSLHYKFKTFEEAAEFLQSELVYLNENSTIKEEMKHLLPYKEKLELAELLPAKIDKYSFARYKYNFYSVPEYLVGKKVTMKVYHDYIKIYSNHKFVCEHKKIDGENEISIDLTHYLNTFSKKPGALRNSLALKSLPQLKSIYDAYFSKNPKEFIEILQRNKDNNISDIMNSLSKYKHSETNIIPFNELKDKATLGAITRTQTQRYNDICIKGGQNNGH
jgi:DNA-binding transcriptional regulator YhcF (GntR family)